MKSFNPKNLTPEEKFNLRADELNNYRKEVYFEERMEREEREKSETEED